MSTFAKSFQKDLKKVLAPFQKTSRESYLLFLLAPLLYGVYHYTLGGPAIAAFLAPKMGWPEADVRVALQYAYSFLFLGMAPAFLIRFVFRKSLRDFGMRLKPYRANGLFILIGLVFVVAADLYAFHFDPEYRRFYPQLPGSLADHGLFPWSVFFFFIYYLGYETFFRGYLLFGMEKILGAVPAILIMTFLTALVHLHRPFSEFLSSIPAGLVFGAFALYTRSYFGILVVHISLGLMLEFLFYFDKIRI